MLGTGQMAQSTAAAEVTGSARTSVGPCVGLVLRRREGVHGIDPFYAEFAAGLERGLRPLGGSVLLQIVTNDAETETYRRWQRGGNVSAVVLGDLVEGDTRLCLLNELGLPVLVLDDAGSAGEVTSLQFDNYGAMEVAARHAISRGHRRLARVTGPSELLHSRSREAAFWQVITETNTQGQTIESDYSIAGGAAATQELLASNSPPTYIVYDNDLMALGGLEAARTAGVPVPGRLSLLAWDDSQSCRLSSPPLSVMRRDVRAIGVAAAEAIVALLDGAAPRAHPTPPPVLIERGTTARPPATT